MKKKSFSTAFLTAIIISGLILVSTVHFGTAQSGTTVTGIISSDTAWTQSGSPYVLVGNTLIYQGVTLTIQPGVTVNLGSYYIMVNGTLNVRGSSTERIIFNGGSISFTSFCNGWNEQALSGCIFENVFVNSTSILSDVSLKINNVYTNGSISVAESIIISNSSITGEISTGASSIITDSSVTGKILVGDSSIITNNSITGNIQTQNFGLIANNKINGSNCFWFNLNCK